MGRSAIRRRAVTAHNVQSYQVEIADLGRLRFSYEMEQRFMAAIADGDAEAARRIMGEGMGLPAADRVSLAEGLDRAMSTSVGIMSRSERKQAEYAAAISVSLFCRAAVKGGMDAQLAYDLADLYLQRISESASVEGYWPIILEALDRYAGGVHEVLSTQIRSIHVLHAKQYVARNLNKPLLLKEVAEAVGISPTYLSTVFSQVEGIGLKEYVLQQRIEAAKDLLMYSTDDIGHIATHVGFCTQSHFGKMFRARVGMTPMAFREAMQK